jgi:hypothetical protein
MLSLSVLSIDPSAMGSWMPRIDAYLAMARAIVATGILQT